MNQPSEGGGEQPAATLSAGALLRQARQAQGMHIVALAASIKVAPRKLEALENDRYEELPDATFARALAQTVCRVLKIDAEPVLARLPQQPIAHRLEHVALGLNAPYRETLRRGDPHRWALLRRPALWGTLLVLIGAAAVWWLPARFWSASLPGADQQPGVAKTSDAVVAASAAPATVVVETVHSAPPPEAAASTSAETPATALAASPRAVPVLLLHTSGESWIEVLDSRGQRLLSRHLQAGETVGLDGGAPLRVTVGNVAATQLSYRGRSIDLAATTRDNTARIELK